MPRRLIISNVLVAHKLMYCPNHKRKGKKGYMSLKLNMSKVCDCVNYAFFRRNYDEDRVGSKNGVFDNDLCEDDAILNSYQRGTTCDQSTKEMV